VGGAGRAVLGFELRALPLEPYPQPRIATLLNIKNRENLERSKREAPLYVQRTKL
jgi:hypothetical protein